MNSSQQTLYFDSYSWYLICNFISTGLITMDECILTVSGMNRKWQTGKCLLFNDAFPHGVTHLGSDEKGPRCVLIVDLWHPDITMQERNSIDYIFSPVNE